MCLCVTPVRVLEGCHSHSPLAPFTPAAQPHDHSRTYIPSPEPAAWSGRDVHTPQDPRAERGCGGGPGGPSSPLRMQSPSACRLVHGWPTVSPASLSPQTRRLPFPPEQSPKCPSAREDSCTQACTAHGKKGVVTPHRLPVTGTRGERAELPQPSEADTGPELVPKTQHGRARRLQQGSPRGRKPWAQSKVGRPGVCSQTGGQPPSQPVCS